MREVLACRATHRKVRSRLLRRSAHDTVRRVSLYDIPVKTLTGEDSSLGSQAGKTLLVVNVASKCGLTPQYTALEALHARLSPRGFSVVGFPCNQFGGQEPGSSEEIAEFCSATYGVTFPMFEKIEVNGSGRHPVYDELTAFPDTEGEAGDIKWNFEKFVLGPDGSILARFRPMTTPDDPAVLAVIEESLPA
jgi:glutathione peroxidase